MELKVSHMASKMESQEFLLNLFKELRKMGYQDFYSELPKELED